MPTHLVAAVAAMIAVVPALAHDHGRFTDSPLKPWFDQLASGKRMCCSFADGVNVEIDDGDNLGSTENREALGVVCRRWPCLSKIEQEHAS